VAEVALLKVNKAFDGTPVLNELSLQVADGEFCVVLGPSGCGKSTLLRLLAGLEEVDSGTITLAGKDVTAWPPQKRNVGMVFQNYALYPHMTVAENIGLPLRLRKQSVTAIDGRVREVAALLGLEQYLERRPRQLSGGQRQRVALGRAIAHHPQVYLFDEPLSNVDALLRVRMRNEISRLWQSLNATVVYVTHDQTEALALGQKICVLNEGRVQQIGTPEEVYHRPANTFVAGFVGTPPINFVRGTLRFKQDLIFEPLEILMPLEQAGRMKAWHDREIMLGIRPEDVATVAESRGAGVLKAEIEQIEFLGSVTWVSCRTAGIRLVARAAAGAAYRAGQMCYVQVDTAKLHWFDVETGGRV